MGLIEGSNDLNVLETLNNELDFQYLRSKLADSYKNYVEGTLKMEASSKISSVLSKLCSSEIFFKGKFAY